MWLKYFSREQRLQSRSVLNQSVYDLAGMISGIITGSCNPLLGCHEVRVI